MNLNWHELPVEEVETHRLEAHRLRQVERNTKMFQDIRKGRARMLEADEERQLIEAVQTKNDQKALQTLVTSHDPMIIAMANDVARRNTFTNHTEDLRAIGLQQIIETIYKFDPSKGARLSSFAKQKIRGAMLHYVLEMRLPVRTSTSAAERRAFYRFPAAMRAFQLEHGRRAEDTPKDNAILSDMLNAPVAALRRARNTHTGYPVPLGSVEVWSDESAPENLSSVQRLLQGEFTKLDHQIGSRDAEIVREFLSRRFENASVADEIGKKNDLTATRVQQITRDALRRIRKSLAEKGLTDTASIMSVA